MQATLSKKTIWAMSSYSFLVLGIMVGFIYTNTFATEVLQIPAQVLAGPMLIAKVIDFIFSLLCGSIIEKVQIGKKGKNQGWINFGRIVVTLTVLTSMIPTTAAPMIVRLLVLAVSYCVLNSTMNMVQTAYYNLVAIVSGPNPANRNSIMVNQTRLNTIINFVTAFIPTLVTIMPLGIWNYFIVSLIFVIPMPIALGVVQKQADGMDLRVGEGGVVYQISVKDMFGTLLKNPMVLSIFVTQVIAYISQYIAQTQGSYYWIYVAGNFSLMTISSLVGSICGIVAGLFMPKVGAKIGKKNAYFLTLCAAGIVGILNSFLAQKGWQYLIVTTAISTFFMYISSPYIMLMYLDAGEWYLNKTGKDTRGICVGLMSPPLKIGMAVGGTIGLAMLAATGFYPGFTPDPTWVGNFCRSTYMIPGIINLCAAVFLMISYRMNEQEAQRMAQENAAKIQASIAAASGAPAEGAPSDGQE